jgi:tetratricopeptide (TPR) repeat protein
MFNILVTTILAVCAQSTDQLVLTDGTVIDVDKITAETYSEVSYKIGSSTGRKDAADVAEVFHKLGNSKLEAYASGVDSMNAGDFEEAVYSFRDVLADDKLLERTTYAWANQHARFREMRCLYSLAQFKVVAEKADALIAAVPDTFFYAPALLMKAKALSNMGDKAGATAVYKQLDSDVVSKSLSRRWENEAELGLVLLDSKLSAEGKQRELQGLAEKNADSYPTVAARARVEVGHAMVEAQEYEKAYNFFTAILEDETSTEAVLASAISGMGDSSYRQALAMDSLEGQKPLLENAILDFLTVASVYREHVEFVPRAMFFAGDALKRIGDSASAKKVASRLDKLFPGSSWKSRLFSELNLK